MLQVRDKDEPVVDPEVRDQVNDGDFRERALVRPEREERNHDGQANVGRNDLPKVLRLEQDRVRVKVWGRERAIARETLCNSLAARRSSLTVRVGRVVALAGSVAEKVHGPAKDLLQYGVVERDNGGFLDGLAELLAAERRDAADQQCTTVILCATPT